MPTMKKLKSNSKTSVHSRSSSVGSNLSNLSNNNNETNNTSPYFDITKYLEQEKFVQQKWQQERLRQEVSI